MALEFEAATARYARTGERTGGSARGRGVSARDRMLLTEQLALMLEGGVSLHAALDGVRRQVKSVAVQSLLAELAEDVSNGRPFSAALARHPRVFSQAYVNLIAASEDGGFMHAVLDQILRMEERREKLRDAVMSALFYPGFLFVFSIAVIAFVLVVVFPKFGPMFASIHEELPPTTLVLMHLSDSLSRYWMYWLAAVAAGGLGLRAWVASPAGKATLDRMKLYAPLLRDVFVQLYMVQSMRVLGLSLANGVSVVDALAACREVVNNSIFRRFLATVEMRVQEGSGLAAGFREADFAPPVVRQMIATGESTGSLARVMHRLADFYEQDLEKRLARFSKLAEPLMLLFMGALVGVLVASLILPIFKLSRAVT